MTAYCLKRNKHSTNFSNKLCPDAYFLKSVKKNFINRKFHFIRDFVNYCEINNKNNYIIILIESPHFSEFSKYGMPLGPANGKTGRNLEKYFKFLLKKINSFMGKDAYDVVLVNPIQFQTSLGIKTEEGKKIRDKNWSRMWRKPCNDFMQRLNSFIPLKGKNHVIIINSCTKGGNEKRKEKVTESIKEGLRRKRNVILLEGYHPSTSWFVRNMNSTIYKFDEIEL